MSVADCQIIELPKISDRRGNLTFIEEGNQIPFLIKRVYYLFDVPGGADRGGHAHRELSQLMVAMSGSFQVTLDDGSERRAFTLAAPDKGLYICPMIWRTLNNFSSGAVCMVLASNFYDEADYIRGYDKYIAAIKKMR